MPATFATSMRVKDAYAPSGAITGLHLTELPIWLQRYTAMKE